MRTALLRGREHLELGAVDAVSEGPAALAISRGGAPKTYPHQDPNEDAALFALGPGGTLVAVADGHRGFEASEVALEYVATHPAPHWTEAGAIRPASWRRQASAVLEDANRAILGERGDLDVGPRTTLALALVVPAEGLLLYAAVGDSHVYLVDEKGVRDLAARPGTRVAFLGQEHAAAEALDAHAAIGEASLAGARAVVLASDGISEEGIGFADPARAILDALDAAALEPPALRPLAAARGLAERACASHRRLKQGDNVVCAVVWLAPDAAG
ncbi:MAG TPA: protein phosphatase 2C domain-containing protein [Myxococcota bacterium]|nr:protein phosphatase 2C domain-containing protein [Myxococcota bacterium]